jgi:methylated-DNA-protein-cysteine methyltransferase-like protein
MKTSVQKQNIFKKIYKIVEAIPVGNVSTYGQIASLVQAELPARIVGYALHCLPDNSEVPWHRVINRFGLISISASRNSHDYLQRTLLEKENVVFDKDGKINLDRYLWRPLLNKQP